jgi:hypothetical protein
VTWQPRGSGDGGRGACASPPARRCERPDDYVAADRSILALATRRLGPVHVLTTAIDEVERLDEAACRRLGLQTIEPDLAQLTEAAAKRGSLSTEDHPCLIVARAQRWTCVTNDVALRKACKDESLRVFWGLEVMTELVQRAELGAEDAITVAWAIHRRKFSTLAPPIR